MSVLINSSGSYDISRSDHQIVRVNGTTLYAVLQQTITVGSGFTVFKSTTNGDSWSSVASHAPAASGGASANSYLSPSCCIDSSGIIRIGYIFKFVNTFVSPFNLAEARYIELDPSTDSFQNDTAAFSGMSTVLPDFYTDCAIADGSFQYVYMNLAGSRGAFYRNIGYITTANRGASWTTPVTISITENDLYYPSIAIEGQSTKLPIIAASRYSSNVGLRRFIFAAKGNAQVATGFTINTSLSLTGYTVAAAPTPINAPRIFQDYAGNEMVAISAKTTTTDPITTEHPMLLYHNHADSWATWTALSFGTSQDYNNTSGFSRTYLGGGQDENIIVAPVSGAQERYENYLKAPDTDEYNTRTQTLSPAPSYIKLRWANYWEDTMNRIDYIYQNSTNIYYDNFDLNIST